MSKVEAYTEYKTSGYAARCHYTLAQTKNRMTSIVFVGRIFLCFKL